MTSPYRVLRRDWADRRITSNLRRRPGGLRENCKSPAARCALQPIWILSIVTAVLAFDATPNRAAEPSGIVWHQDFRQAAQESARLQKPILVEITASWCGYCRKMEKETFSDVAVARHVQRCFVPVTVNADREKQLVKLIGIEGLPTTVIISPELEIVRRITGFQGPSEFNAHLDEVCPANHDREVGRTALQSATRGLPTGKTVTSGDTPARRAASAPAQGLPTRKTVASGDGAATGVNEPSASGAVRQSSATATDFAFDGLCLVSLLDERKLVRGNDQHQLTFRKMTICFASEEFKERFRSKPLHYWPALDGHCVVSAVEEERLEPGRPELAVFYWERLWFFDSLEHRQKFASQPENYVPSQPRH